MDKLMRKIAVVNGYLLFILGLFLPVINGNTRTFTLIGLWVDSLTSGNFSQFWASQFPVGIEAEIGTGFLLLVILASFLDAVVLTFKKKTRILPMIKNVALFFAFFFLGQFSFFTASPGVLPMPILALLEFLLMRYLEGKEERDQQYAEQTRKNKAEKLDKKQRLSFKGKYPSLFKQIINKNLLFYRQNLLILSGANFISYLSIALLIFSYRSFSAGQGQQSIFDKTGLLPIFIESGGILVLLLIIFLTFINGMYLTFKENHGELWFLLGIRRNTFLWMLIREYLICVGVAVVCGIIVTLPLVRLDFWSYLLAILIQLFLAVITLGFHQEKTLRLLQFKPKSTRKVERINFRGKTIWLLIGLLFLAITFWWFARRKSAETYLVLLTLAIGLIGLVNGLLRIFLAKLQKRQDYLQHFLTFNDFTYRFRKSANLIIILILLQVFSLGFLLPRLATGEMVQVDQLFPYDIVAKIHNEELPQLEKVSQKYQADLLTFPMVPITSVDGDSDPEIYGVARPIMYIQGQHVGISETTYQQLRKLVGEKEKPLNLKKDQWHVVYQQGVNISAQPIDWDPGSKEPRLRIGTPLDFYDTNDIDQIFPMRDIKSQERNILTGMFQRGLQENLIVLADEAFPETQQQLVLIQSNQAKAMIDDLLFIDQTYASERRWDEKIQPYYWKKQQEVNVKNENKLEMIVLVFLLTISLLLSFSLLLTKYLGEKDFWTEKQNLLSLLGTREKERRKILNRQLRLFFWLPLIAAGLISMVFIFIMSTIRFFNPQENLQFFWRIIIVDSCYAAVWYIVYRMFGNQIMKWVSK